MTREEDELRWERFVDGGDPVQQASHGAWRFQIRRWQRGSYLVSIVNTETGERWYEGDGSRKLSRLADAKWVCESRFRRLLREQELA